MPIPAARCQYLGKWVETNLRWNVSVNLAERNALLHYAAGCPNTTPT
ncbi:hypothetical protein ACF1GS_38835 [Streptomyces eurythermus]